jgi:hypothetical protein
MQYNEFNQKPFNENSERHGYWEVYWQNGRVHFCGYFINDEPLGFIKWQHVSGPDNFHKQYYAR